MAIELNSFLMTTEPVQCYAWSGLRSSVDTLAISGVRTNLTNGLQPVDWLAFPSPELATEILIRQLSAKPYQLLLLPLFDLATGEGLDVESLAYQIHAHFPNLCVLIDVDTHLGHLPIYMRPWFIDGLCVAEYYLAHEPLVFARTDNQSALDISGTSLYAQLNRFEASTAPVRWNQLRLAVRTFRQALITFGGTILAHQPTDLLTVWEMNNDQSIECESTLTRVATTLGFSISAQWAGVEGRFGVWHCKDLRRMPHETGNPISAD